MQLTIKPHGEEPALMSEFRVITDLENGIKMLYVPYLLVKGVMLKHGFINLKEAYHAANY